MCIRFLKKLLPLFETVLVLYIYYKMIYLIKMGKKKKKELAACDGSKKEENFTTRFENRMTRYMYIA